jgi:hypothetical protein
MTKVACFCGCCYSFSDGTGTCPNCGKTAVSAPALGPHIGRGRPRSQTLVLSDGQRTLLLADVRSALADGLAPSPGVGAEN